MFPGLPRTVAEDRVALWMGFRPSMPDSLPVIGSTRRYANAFLAFGHGHVGLIGAPMTGRAIADLIAGRPPGDEIGDGATGHGCADQAHVAVPKSEERVGIAAGRPDHRQRIRHARPEAHP